MHAQQGSFSRAAYIGIDEACKWWVCLLQEQQSSGHETSGRIGTYNPQRGNPNATGRMDVKLDEAQ